MIRKSVHKAVGGYDVSIQNGFEDWDFWLRSANHGFWGAIIPEFLNWYRRRPLNSRPWPTLKSPLKRHLFRVGLWKKYGKLFFRFPKIRRRTEGIYRSVPDDVPFPNQLDKKRNRILMVLPWMTMGGADKFNLDFIEQMIGAGYEVSICTTVNGPSPLGSGVRKPYPGYHAAAELHQAFGLSSIYTIYDRVPPNRYRIHIQQQSRL